MKAGKRIRNQTAIVWGVLAEIGLAGSLFTWFISPEAVNVTIFGAAGSATVVILALVATAIVILFLASPLQMPRTRRLGIAIPTAVIGGCVAVISLKGILGAQAGVSPGLSFLLAFAVIGMCFVSAELARD